MRTRPVEGTLHNCGMEVSVETVSCIICQKAISTLIDTKISWYAPDVTHTEFHSICSLCERDNQLVPALAPDGTEGMAFLFDENWYFIFYEYALGIWRSYEVMDNARRKPVEWFEVEISVDQDDEPVFVKYLPE